MALSHRASQKSRVAANMPMSLIIGAVSAFNLWLFWMVLPYFEKIYPDLIPEGLSKLAQLPLLTQAVLGWLHLAPAPQLFVIGLGTWAIAIQWRRRGPYTSWLVRMTLLVLMAHWMIAALGCFLPFVILIFRCTQCD